MRGRVQGAKLYMEFSYVTIQGMKLHNLTLLVCVMMILLNILKYLPDSYLL